MLVGHYAMVAMTLNSLGVEPEASAVAALDGSSRQTADLLDDRLDSWITQSR